MTYRCPMCGLPIEIEEDCDEDGNEVWKCLSKTDDCENRWQCPLNKPLKKEQIPPAEKS